MDVSLHRWLGVVIRITTPTHLIHSHKFRSLDKIAVVFKTDICIHFDTPTFVAEIFPREIHTPELCGTKDQALIPDPYTTADRSIELRDRFIVDL